MSVVLRPRPRFPWGAVSWGGPDEPPADDCSLCDAPIAEDDVPLVGPGVVLDQWRAGRAIASSRPILARALDRSAASVAW
jgi:hypothetical protein